MVEFLIDLDQSVTLFINQFNSSSADKLMSLVSGKLTWLPLYFGLAFLMYKVFGWKRALVILLFAGVNVLLTDQVSVVFKEFFLRLRPCHEPSFSNLLHLPNGCGGQFGFVSSHAANTMGLAVLMSLVFRNPRITISMLAFGLINGYSRIYLGVHYFFDVVGGFILGAGIAYIVYQLLRLVLRKYKIS